MKDISTKQKLIAVVLSVVFGLLAFANVAALGILAAPPFAMYAAIIIAVALTITTLTVSFIEKRKLTFLKQTSIPFTAIKTVNQATKFQFPIIKQRNIKTVATKIGKQHGPTIKQPTIQINKQLTTQSITHLNPSQPIELEQKSVIDKVAKEDAKHDDAEQRDLSPKQPTFQPYEQPTIQAAAQSNIEKPIPIQQELVKEKGKMSCPICNKEFSQPMLMADYSMPNKPNLIAHCPYCFQPLSQKQNTTDEETWKKYV